MIKVEVSGDREFVARLKAMPARVRFAVERWAWASGLDVEAAAKQLVSGDMLNVRTGRGRSSINTKVESTRDAVTATVGVPRGYMAIQHEGVPHPWPIEARNAKALRFTIGGQTIFRRRVTHRSRPPRPFLLSALAEMAPQIEAELRAEITEAIAA